MKRLALFLLLVTATAGSSVVAMPSGVAVASKGASQNFCVPVRVIIEEVQAPVLDVTASRAPVLAVTLKHAAKNAPKVVGKVMKQMASTYALLAKPSTDANRAKVLFDRAAKFPAQAKVLADYYSTHCVTKPVSSPSFGPVVKANLAACQADAQVLQLAETEYSTLNGVFGTMSQLVGARLVRTPSVYHPEITVGSPPGGYTIVGNQGCDNLPVVG
jgi:hypothetical protein